MTLTRTYQYAGPRVASDSIAALLIEGDVRFETEVSHVAATFARAEVQTRNTYLLCWRKESKWAGGASEMGI